MTQTAKHILRKSISENSGYKPKAKRVLPQISDSTWNWLIGITQQPFPTRPLNEQLPNCFNLIPR